VKRPQLHIIGDLDHPDFADVHALLRAEADIGAAPPELIVVAQHRPGLVSEKQILERCRQAPLAGVVALLGSWCEGETRTGRPWPGVERLYWYEFPSWWRRQMGLRAAGRCPDWARPGDGTGSILASSKSGAPLRIPASKGSIVLRTDQRDSADAISDLLGEFGYVTACDWPGARPLMLRGAAAGIWIGSQLGESEAADLHPFCQRLALDRAPVITLLDFPRRDRVARAIELGAAAVLGVPWSNRDLIGMIDEAVKRSAPPKRAA
jgi:hypothetical protein